jgi:HAE1 family hydrophobic/amphiphilic exporter-1
MGQQEVRLQVNSEKARTLGVSPETIGNVVGLSFRGRQLRRYQTPEGEVQMILGLPEDSQPGLAALTDLPVPRPSQDPIPLGAVAEVEISRIAPRIFREDRRTTTWINVKFDKEQIATIGEAQMMVKPHMDAFRMPEGYAWSWGRWGRDREEGLSVMLKGVLLSLILVIILMAALFESLTQPLAIVITLPLAFFGAFWSLWLFGFQLDPVSYIGLIILIGIVVNNGIVMVDHVNGLRRKGQDRVEALLEGCGDRLRPVLMTAITTIFGLAPLAASGATIGNTYIDSMPVAVIGGLATSTVFTLLALPVWYTTVEDFGSLLARLFPRLRRRGRPALPRDAVLVDRAGR